MGATFPDLDLSQIIIDDTVPLTPGRDDAVNGEAGDSVHIIKLGAKDVNAETVVQSTPGGLETRVV